MDVGVNKYAKYARMNVRSNARSCASLMPHWLYVLVVYFRLLVNR